MGDLEDEIRAEQVKNTTGAYARFTSIDGIGQKTAEKLRGLRGVDSPSDVEGESAETLADRAGISERRAAKAIRGGGGNAQVRSREARKRANRTPNYFTQIDGLSRDQADELGDVFGDPRTAGQLRAEDVQSMAGVDSQTAETVVLGSGGDPEEVDERRQSIADSAVDPGERGVPLRRQDFPGLDDTELLTEPTGEYTPEARERVRGVALSSAPQLIGPESERTARSDGGGQADTGTDQATQASDGELTDISGVGPKTAEKLRDDGYTSKEDVLDGFTDRDPAVTEDLNARAVRGIREQLFDRGEQFRDPVTNTIAGPDNRAAFQTFAQTTAGDLDSVDTRAQPSTVSSGTSLAALAPKAARGDTGRLGDDLTDFAVDAAANLGLTEMSATRLQEMNRRGTNPTAARLGTPRPEDPYGVSVADEPPADLTNPERLEPNDPAVRTDGPPGPLLTIDLSDEEANAANRTLSLAESPRGTDAGLSRDKVEDTLFDIKDAQDEGRPAELSRDQAAVLADAVSARAEDDRDLSRGPEDFEAFQDVAAGADPRTDDRSEQVSLGLSPSFDAEPAVSLVDTDQSGDPGFQGPTSRRPIPESELQDPDSLGGVYGRSLQGTGLAPSDPEFSERDERQSRRRQTGDRPDDLAEQLAAQRAAPTVTRPDADPAVQLTDTDRLQDSQENGTVTLEGQTQSVADTAVGYAEQKGLVDEGLRDRVGDGELTPEDADKVNTALLSFEAGERKIAREGRTTLMGSPENHAQWADWAQEARQDAFGRFGPSGPAATPAVQLTDTDRMQASDGAGRFGAGGSSAEPAVSLFDTSSGGEQPEPAPTGAESLEDPDLIRLRSSGRFNRDPTVDAPAAPGQRAPANGRFVGDSDNITRPADPEDPIMRDPQTGQYTVTDR